MANPLALFSCHVQGARPHRTAYLLPIFWRHFVKEWAESVSEDSSLTKRGSKTENVQHNGIAFAGNSLIETEVYRGMVLGYSDYAYITVLSERLQRIYDLCLPDFINHSPPLMTFTSGSSPFDGWDGWTQLNPLALFDPIPAQQPPSGSEMSARRHLHQRGPEVEERNPPEIAAWKVSIALLWKRQLQALDLTYVCRLWSSGNSLWIYIYIYIYIYMHIYIYAYIYILWYKCFGVWGSPPINRVSPQVHIDLYIYICLQNCFGWWVPRAYLDWVRWVTCIDYSPRFRWWLFHLLGFDEWHTQVVYFQKCWSPKSRRCSPENIHLIEDGGMFFGFFGVIDKTWKLELYLITSKMKSQRTAVGSHRHRGKSKISAIRWKLRIAAADQNEHRRVTCRDFLRKKSGSSRWLS